MIRSILLFSLIFVAFTATFGAALEVAPLPFWRAKPKVFAKITDERQIIVSVNAEKRGVHSVLLMDGGGLVDTPPDAAFGEAQKYQDLKEVSDHIVEIKTGPAPEDLFVHTEAFKYHARMNMKMKAESDAAGVKHLRFSVVAGNFKGMTGEFNFSDYKAKTVLGFHAEYEYDVLPMPKFFVEFGLEVVLQRVAGSMRTFLEKKYTPKKE